jgi:hypothetical protein
MAFSGMKISEHRFSSERFRGIINPYFMSKGAALLMLGLFITMLVCSIPAGAIQEPLPGQGNQTSILYGVHPNAKKNETITSFLAEHGEITWHESGYNRTHETVYITPVNACRERLVYVNREGADEHNNELSIAFVRIIGCGETLPIEPVDPFSDLFQRYPALGEDEDLRSYIENHSPDRYKELETWSSQPVVYFIDDTGVFTEYIVVLEKGRIVSGTYLSEDNCTINRTEAIRQALFVQPEHARIQSALLKIHDDHDGGVSWEFAVLKGPVMDIISIPTGMKPEHSPGRASGFGVLIASCGIITGLMVSRKQR